MPLPFNRNVLLTALLAMLPPVPKDAPKPDCPFCGRGNMVEQVPGTGYRKCDHCNKTLL